MKARIHSEMPDDTTEREVITILGHIDFSELVDVWTARLTGTKDVDIIVVTRIHGLFVLEVKGWQLDDIVKIKEDTSVGLQPWVKSSGTAWKQVVSACDQFKGRINHCALHEYWWSPGVVLLHISKNDFDDRMEVHGPDVKTKRDLMAATIWQNDFADGATLLSALDRVYRHPALNESPKRKPPEPTVAEINELANLYNTYLSLKPPSFTAYDHQRLMTLVGGSAKDANKLACNINVHCSGYTGTGKTIFALQYAIQKGVRTLFLCYNKVLATDIARLIDLSALALSDLGLSSALSKLEAYDVYAWLKGLQSRTGLYLHDDDTLRKSDPDRWASLVVELFRSKYKGKDLSELVGEYQLIAVDEAQDLQDWVWILLEFVIENIATHPPLFIIESKEQMLYLEKPSQELHELLQLLEIQKVRRNRVFRTSNETFIISQLFVESQLDWNTACVTWLIKLSPHYNRIKEKPGQAAEMELPDLPRQGRAPKLWCVNAMSWFKDSPSMREMGLVNWLTNLIVSRLKQLRVLSGQPSDLLILIPFEDETKYGTQFNWLKIARKACEQAEAQYIDYTIDEVRRVQYYPSEVRISTFHSARGVEGLHVIVLGFELLARAALHHSWRIPHLGYIVLSRSVYDTDIVYFRPVGNQEVWLLEEIIRMTGFPTNTPTFTWNKST